MSPTKTTARLEARIDTELREQIQKAAELSHTTLTAFVTAALRAASQQVIEQHSWVTLTLKDQERFCKSTVVWVYSSRGEAEDIVSAVVSEGIHSAFAQARSLPLSLPCHSLSTR